MSKQEHYEQQLEPLSGNGWQNIGICHTFAVENVPFKLQALYMQIVRYSFGYLQLFTPRWTQLEWASRIGISRPTFTDQIHKLLELNLVRINESSKFIQGGGSEAFSYAPSFPKGYGQLKFKPQEEKQEVQTEKGKGNVYNGNEYI